MIYDFDFKSFFVGDFDFDLIHKSF